MSAIEKKIPMYNDEKYIEHTINSVLNRTFKDFEIIVVDDRSNDHSVEIVEKIMNSPHRRGGGIEARQID